MPRRTSIRGRTDDPSPIMCGGSCSLREAVIAEREPRAGHDPAPGRPDLHALDPGRQRRDPRGRPGHQRRRDHPTIGDSGNATISRQRGRHQRPRPAPRSPGDHHPWNVDVVGGVGPTDGGTPPHHNGGGIQVDSGAALNIALDSNINGNSVPGLGDLGGGSSTTTAPSSSSGAWSPATARAEASAVASTRSAPMHRPDPEVEAVRQRRLRGRRFAAGGGETEVFNSQLSFNSSGDGGAAFVGNGSATSPTRQSTTTAPTPWAARCGRRAAARRSRTRRSVRTWPAGRRRYQRQGPEQRRHDHVHRHDHRQQH